MSQEKPSASTAAPRGRPPRRSSPVLTRFSFVNSYSVVDKDENPLITGEIDEIEAGGEQHTGNEQMMLHIDLHDLVKAKTSFQGKGEAGSLTAELTLKQFVDAFGRMVSPEMRQQLGYLFMKIDCNCDGKVSWDELLTYVMSQDRNEQKPEGMETQLVQAEIPECPGDEAHRDLAHCSIFAPKCNLYVTGGRDGSLRVWGTDLRLQLNLPVSTEKAMTAVQAMVLLPGHLNKLVVASADRMVSLYELQDLAGSRRWSVWGRVQLKDMPVSLAAFIHVSDGSHCLAIGTDAGSVPIIDAKKLLSMLKEDRVRKEVGRDGGVPFKVVEASVILTLPLHIDWVCHLAYLADAAALVSGSLDTLLMVTQLDWPLKSVPSNTRGDKAMVKADPNHCRSMCCIPAHSKGVTCFQLMNISSRKLCATCSYERDAKIFNIETGDLARTLVGHRSLLRELAFDEATQVLVTLAADGEMRTWEMISYSLLQIIRPESMKDRISSVHFNAAQQCLVTTTRRLQLWQHPRKTATEEVINASLIAPKGHCNPLVAVLYSHQFHLVITGDEAGLICVWDVRSGHQAFRFEHGSRLTAMHLDTSGRKLMTGGADGDVRLWNYSSGEELKQISSYEAPKVEVTALLHIHLPKVSYFVSVGWGRDVWMWPDRREERGQAHPRRLVGHTEDILCVAFCPPNLLFSGAYDGTLISHSIESGAINKRVPPKRRDDAAIESGDPVAFAHSLAIETMVVLDPQRQVLPESALVCGTADGYLSIYSTSSMQLLDEIHACAPGEGVNHLCMEASTTFVVTGDSSGRIKVWDVSNLGKRWPTEREFRYMALMSHFDVPSMGSTTLLYSWRAHPRGICHVEYLTGIDGVITASSDCTVRMWTLSGEQVGVFGQSQAWTLGMRDRWFDDTGVALNKALDDKVLATEKRLRALQPPQPPRPAQQSAVTKRGGPTGAMGQKGGFYRLQGPQLEELARLGNLLNVKEARKGEPQPTSKDVIASLPPVTSMGDLRRATTLLNRTASQNYTPLNQGNGAMVAAVSKKGTLWKPIAPLSRSDSMPSSLQTLKPIPSRLSNKSSAAAAIHATER